jgi:hypothetical protein
MPGKRNRLAEMLATAWGAAKLMLLFGSFFVVLGVISLGRIYSSGPFAPFVLGNVNIPKFMSPTATNLAVFSFCAAGLFFVIIAVVWRYFHHRKTLRFLREKGVRDFDGDGKTDNFADTFLDDL